MIVDWNGARGRRRLHAWRAPSTASSRRRSRRLRQAAGWRWRSDWMLSQPDAELALGGGAPVALQPLAAAGAAGVGRAGARRARHVPVVDAGTAAALEHSRRQAARSPSSRATAATSPMRPARLPRPAPPPWSRTPGDGAECAGTLDQPAPLPAFQARPFEALRLLGRRGAGRAPDAPLARVHLRPRRRRGTVAFPPGRLLDGAARHVAAFVEDYRLARRHVGLRAIGSGTWGSAGCQDAASPPSASSAPSRCRARSRTMSARSAEWGRTVEVRDADGRPEGALDAPSRPVAARETIRDRWFGGPIVAKASPLGGRVRLAGPLRTGRMTTSGWCSRRSSTTRATRASRSTSGSSTGSCTSTASSSPRATTRSGCSTSLRRSATVRARLRDAPRERVLAALDRTSRRAGGSPRERPAGDHETLPLIDVDYDLALSSLNTARPGPFSFGVGFRLAPGAAPSPITSVVVEVSWNGGTTWSPAASKCKRASCTVQVRNPSSGSASLRVTATDAAGRSVVQTVSDAYGVANEEPGRNPGVSLMGDPGFEPGTSALSERRSNQLS